MALFLNTPKLNLWIPKLIQEAEKELVLIVPYIQISKNIFNSLKIANKNGVEIILIYRENKLSDIQKEKLLSLSNINLLHHPNIHCKCYFNGDLLIISSMNLYDYSEKNNREMGTLFFKWDTELDNTEKEIQYYSDDKEIFDDAVFEIKDIVRGSSIENLSERTKKTSFNVDIIKTDEEIEIDWCNKINKYFLNKKFKPFENSKNIWFSKCENFFDNVDVVFEYRRIAMIFKLNEKELKVLYSKWNETYEEFEFRGFKYYWNYYEQPLYVYKDNNFDWDSLKNNDKLRFKKLNEGINLIVQRYRKLTGK